MSDRTPPDSADRWREDAAQLLSAFHRGVRGAARTLARAIDRDPPRVVGYRGYARHDRALVLARALQDAPIAPAAPDRGRLANLADALRRIESDPIAHAAVRARVDGAESRLQADDEGFVHAWVPLARAPRVGWTEVPLSLGDDGALGPVGSAWILHPPATARFGIISDIDDTVLQSEVGNLLRAARLILLENARTRLPFPGVAAFYRALHGAAPDGEGNPIFYVSSSPWNLYEVIADFLDAHEIPRGPLLLRDWDMGGALTRHRGYKRAHIDEIFAAYPSLPFILIGDTSQEDPEIYAEVTRAYPGRVLAVYVRNVHRAPERVAAVRTLADALRTEGATLMLTDDTLAAARHAAEMGWVDAAALPDVAAEKRADAAARMG